jgi:hypothetical protein
MRGGANPSTTARPPGSRALPAAQSTPMPIEAASRLWADAECLARKKIWDDILGRSARGELELAAERPVLGVPPLGDRQKSTTRSPRCAEERGTGWSDATDGRGGADYWGEATPNYRQLLPPCFPEKQPFGSAVNHDAKTAMFSVT